MTGGTEPPSGVGIVVFRAEAPAVAIKRIRRGIPRTPHFLAVHGPARSALSPVLRNMRLLVLTLWLFWTEDGPRTGMRPIRSCQAGIHRSGIDAARTHERP